MEKSRAEVAGCMRGSAWGFGCIGEKGKGRGGVVVDATAGMDGKVNMCLTNDKSLMLPEVETGHLSDCRRP